MCDPITDAKAQSTLQPCRVLPDSEAMKVRREGRETLCVVAYGEANGRKPPLGKPRGGRSGDGHPASLRVALPACSKRNAVTAGEASIEKFAVYTSRRCTICMREAPPTNKDSPRTSDNCAFPNRTARHGFAVKDLLESRLRRRLMLAAVTSRARRGNVWQWHSVRRRCLPM